MCIPPNPWKYWGIRKVLRWKDPTTLISLSVTSKQLLTQMAVWQGLKYKNKLKNDCSTHNTGTSRVYHSALGWEVETICGKSIMVMWSSLSKIRLNSLKSPWISPWFASLTISSIASSYTDAGSSTWCIWHLKVWKWFICPHSWF